jgi:hypothetical protein
MNSRSGVLAVRSFFHILHPSSSIFRKLWDGRHNSNVPVLCVSFDSGQSCMGKPQGLGCEPLSCINDEATCLPPLKAVQRRRLDPRLRELSSLFVADAYRHARVGAAAETGLPLATFPEGCPWPVDQVLDEDFWPEGNRP